MSQFVLWVLEGGGLFNKGSCTRMAPKIKEECPLSVTDVL